MSLFKFSGSDKKKAKNGSRITAFRYVCSFMKQDKWRYSTFIFCASLILTLSLSMVFYAITYYQKSNEKIKGSINEIIVNVPSSVIDDLKYYFNADKVEEVKEHPLVVDSFANIGMQVSLSIKDIAQTIVYCESTIANHPGMNEQTLFLGKAISRVSIDEIIVSKGLIKKFLSKNAFSKNAVSKFIGTEINLSLTRTNNDIEEIYTKPFILAGVTNDNIVRAFIAEADMIHINMWANHQIDLGETITKNANSFLSKLSICIDDDISIDELKAIKKNFSLVLQDNITVKDIAGKKATCYEAVRPDNLSYTERDISMLKKHKKILSVDAQIVMDAEFNTGSKIPTKLLAVQKKDDLSNSPVLAKDLWFKERNENTLILPKSLAHLFKIEHGNTPSNVYMSFSVKNSDTNVSPLSLSLRVSGVSNTDISQIPFKLADDIAKWQNGLLDYDENNYLFFKKEEKEETLPESTFSSIKILVGNIDHVAPVADYYESLGYDVQDKRKMLEAQASVIKTIKAFCILVATGTLLCTICMFFFMSGMITENRLDEYIVLKSMGASNKFIKRLFALQSYFISIWIFIISALFSLLTIYYVKIHIIHTLGIEKLTFNFNSIEIKYFAVLVFITIVMICRISNMISYRRIKHMDIPLALKRF